MTLTLRGPVPRKKSKYRRSRGRGLHLDEVTRATIDGLILQARSQWRREPVEHRGDYHPYRREAMKKFEAAVMECSG